MGSRLRSAWALSRLYLTMLLAAAGSIVFGLGSTFWVKLPYAAPLVAAA